MLRVRAGSVLSWRGGGVGIDQGGGGRGAS